MKQTNETHIHVGTKGRGFVIIILWLLAGCIIGSVATAKYGHYVGIGGKSNDVAFTTNGNGVTVSNEGTVPVGGTIKTDPKTITLVKYVPREVTKPYSKAQVDSIVNSHIAERTYTQTIDDNNITAIVTDVVAENVIQDRTFTYNLKNPPPKTHVYAGGAINIGVSPFEVSGAGVRTVLIPKSSKIAYSLSYDVLQNRFEASALFRLTRQFPKQ